MKKEYVTKSEVHMEPIQKYWKCISQCTITWFTLAIYLYWTINAWWAIPIETWKLNDNHEEIADAAPMCGDDNSFTVIQLKP